MKKKFKGTICVYCAINPSETDDHAFAKQFLLLDKREKRQNILDVPACEPCNNEKSKLERYLTAVLPFGGRHEDARLNLENVPKRLSGNPSLRRSLAQGRRKVWVQERHGLYVPTTVLPIEPGSIEKLFEFIVKGLVWRHWQSYITAEYFVEVEALREGEGDRWEYFFSNINPHLKVRADLGNGTFLYEGFRDIDSPQTTDWRFSLYGGLRLGGGPKERREVFSQFYAYTGPIEIRKDAEPASQSPVKRSP